MAQHIVTSCSRLTRASARYMSAAPPSAVLCIQCTWRHHGMDYGAIPDAACPRRTEGTYANTAR